MLEGDVMRFEGMGERRDGVRCGKARESGVGIGWDGASGEGKDWMEKKLSDALIQRSDVRKKSRKRRKKRLKI